MSTLSLLSRRQPALAPALACYSRRMLGSCPQSAVPLSLSSFSSVTRSITLNKIGTLARTQSSHNKLYSCLASSSLLNPPTHNSAPAAPHSTLNSSSSSLLAHRPRSASSRTMMTGKFKVNAPSMLLLSPSPSPSIFSSAALCPPGFG